MQQPTMGQPVFILREGTERKQGFDAQGSNITAAMAVASAVRTTLGPKGMDKMLVDSMGTVVITNDGSTILKEIDIEHPAAKMMVEIAKTQDDEVGDGTTTAVVIAGELLRHASDLLERDIHPTVIAHGYRMATDRAEDILRKVAISVTPDDTALLTRIAATAMSGKGGEEPRENLCALAVKAVSTVADDRTVDRDFIKVEKVVGGSSEDSTIVEGVVLSKERAHPRMPKVVSEARILLLAAAVEHRKTEIDAGIRITNPDQLHTFLDEEERLLRTLTDRIIATGANVLFCQKGIDDVAQHHLAKAGILAVRRVKKSDMVNLARATHAEIISSLDAIEGAVLGDAAEVREKKVSGEEMIFVTGCKSPKAVSILVRGGTEHVVDELERALEDAIRVVALAVEDGTFVIGGGAVEIELAEQLREYAVSIGGRAQLAIEAFADAVESIPKTLAENAGLDTIDMLVALRTAHDAGDSTAGIDANDGRVADMRAAGVIEPLHIKMQAIASAAEAAIMILRIDDVIASSGGGAPGMPAAPPGMEEY
jgi:thermosome